MSGADEVKTEYPSFNSMFPERAEREKRKKHDRLAIKFGIFTCLLMFYAYMFFEKGYWQYFLQYNPAGGTATADPSQALVIFIIGAIFIWLPMKTLQNIGQIKFVSWGSGGMVTPTPAQGLRFFGWAIYIAPACFYLLGMF